MQPIDIQNVTKDFGQGRGVFDISFSVKEGEVFGYLGYGMMIGGFQGPARGPGDARDVLVTEFIEVTQQKDRALLRGKLLDGLVQAALKFIPIEIGVRVDFTAECLVQRCGKGESCPDFLPAQEIQSFVGGNAIDPGVQRGNFPERIQGSPYFNECLLQKVICILVGAGKTPDVPVETLLVGVNKGIESLLPLARAVQGHQLPVGQVHFLEIALRAASAMCSLSSP